MRRTRSKERRLPHSRRNALANHNADISAAMSASMANIELDGLTGKAKWTEDGECDKEPKAFEIKDGAYVEMK